MSDSDLPEAKRVPIDININFSFDDIDNNDSYDIEMYNEIRAYLIEYYCPEEYLELMCNFHMQEPFGIQFVCLEFLYAFSHITFTYDNDYIYDSIFKKYEQTDKLDAHIKDVQEAICVWFSNQHITKVMSMKNKIKKSENKMIDNFVDYTYKIKNSFYILLDNGFSVFYASIAVFLMNVRENIYYFSEINGKKMLDVDSFRCVYIERSLFAKLIEGMGVSLEELKKLNNMIWDLADLPNEDKYEIDYDSDKCQATFT